MTTPNIVARTTPSLKFIAPLSLLPLESVAATDLVHGPAQSTLVPCAVRLTGDGATALDYCELSGPGIIPGPVVLVPVRGISAPDVFMLV